MPSGRKRTADEECELALKNLNWLMVNKYVVALGKVKEFNKVVDGIQKIVEGNGSVGMRKWQ